jgi:hypothetical protein
VQDGHSVAEQLVYDTLWREASPATEDYREISIGYRTLAEKARLHRNTIDRNLESLHAKLAIETFRSEDRAGNIGRSYRVFAFRAILSRREAAGLIWYVKNRSGVRLLRNEDLNHVTTEVIGPVTSEMIPPVTSQVIAPVTSEMIPPVTSEVIGPVTSQVTAYKEEASILGTSSTSPVAVALQEELGYVDDDVVHRIIAGCRKRVADATPGEIADFTRVTARRVRRMRNIANPVGLVIVQVPKCFEGPSFQVYRQVECERLDAERKDLVRVATEVLADSSMPADSREWAITVLSQENATACTDKVG